MVAASWGLDLFLVPAPLWPGPELALSRMARRLDIWPSMSAAQAVNLVDFGTLTRGGTLCEARREAARVLRLLASGSTANDGCTCAWESIRCDCSCFSRLAALPLPRCGGGGGGGLGAGLPPPLPPAPGAAKLCECPEGEFVTVRGEPHIYRCVAAAGGGAWRSSGAERISKWSDCIAAGTQCTSPRAVDARCLRALRVGGVDVADWTGLRRVFIGGHLPFDFVPADSDAVLTMRALAFVRRHSGGVGGALAPALAASVGSAGCSDADTPCVAARVVALALGLTARGASSLVARPASTPTLKKTPSAATAETDHRQKCAGGICHAATSVPPQRATARLRVDVGTFFAEQQDGTGLGSTASNGNDLPWFEFSEVGSVGAAEGRAMVVDQAAGFIQTRFPAASARDDRGLAASLAEWALDHATTGAGCAISHITRSSAEV